MPAQRRRARRCVAVVVCMRTVSVISRISRAGSRPLAAQRASRPPPTRSGCWNWRAERFTLDRQRVESCDRRQACGLGGRRCSRTHRPIGTMRPVSSARPMKSAGRSAGRARVLPADERLDARRWPRRSARRSAGSGAGTRRARRRRAARASSAARSLTARRACSARRPRSGPCPACLALYIATSASRSSSSRASARRRARRRCRRWRAMTTPCRRAGSARRARRARARRRASPRLVAQVLEQDGELVAAEPGGGVAGPAGRTGAARPTATRSSSPAAWPRLSLTVLKSSRSRNSTATADVRPAPTACERVLDPVLEQAAVGQAGQRVVERLVAQLLVQPARSRAPSRPRRPGSGPAGSVARRRIRAAREVASIGPERATLGHQRQRRHRPMADRLEIGHLGRIGGRVGVVDDHR